MSWLSDAVNEIGDTVDSAWKWVSDNVSGMPLDYFSTMATLYPSATIGGAQYFIPRHADNDVNAVMSGSKWAGSVITYSMPDSRSDYEWINPSASGFKRLSYETEQAFHSILKGYSPNGGTGMRLTSVESFTKLSFQYAGRNNAEIKLAGFTPGSVINRSHGYYPGVPVYGGDLWLKNGDTVPVLGSHQYYIMLHELGHVLGLKHTHDQGANIPKMSAAHDRTEYSVMSYDDHDYPQTYMMYDIAALQEMYGANFNTNSGNTIYKWNSSTGETYVNGVGQGRPGTNKIFLTIWDGGGVDTYDFSNYNSSAAVDLNPGRYSLFSATQQGIGAKGNVYNALQHRNDDRSLIENAIGGSGNDKITGNKTDNQLRGSAGHDTLDGGNGNDSLYGDAGNDSLLGGAGHDKLWGSWGNDILKGEDGNDFLAGEGDHDTMFGGAGQDSLWGGAGQDGLYGDNGNDFLAGEAGNDTLWGGADQDTLYGGTDHDTLYGDAGNDTLYGEAGNDSLWASWGDDALSGNDGNDFLAGEGGNDALSGGAGDDRAYGGEGNDRLNGDDGNDVLAGENGNDTLSGGAGADQLWGGAGSDKFVFNTALSSTSNVDYIGDFDVREDRIELDSRVFMGLISLKGTLVSSSFVVGDGASTQWNRIIYKATTGELFYDADGSGAGAAVKFAELSKGLALTAANFLVV